MSYTTKIIEKLALDKDLSVGREPVGKGRFRHFFFIFKKNMTGIMLMNFFMLIFAVPFIFLLLFLLPQLEVKAISGFNFSGELGMGVPGATSDFIPASHMIYQTRMIMMACLVPCISLIGLGMSGGFYCARNFLWGTKVKMRVHFFRGIKKHWWQFISSFTIIGAVLCGIAISIINHLDMSVEGAAPWWSYILMIGLCILGVLVIMFFLFFLPMQSAYNQKYSIKIKNSVRLAMLLVVPSIIIMIILGLPTLLLISDISKIFFYMLMAMFGIGMYVLAISAFGQYSFDSFINYLYEQKTIQEEKERLRSIKVQNREKGKVNNKKKKR